ncbi:MAG: hypothetical protein MUE42_15945, partial [Opitutaceae bacterium]|nr:hypothetical protein [Opitutaceae bacterium]
MASPVMVPANLVSLASHVNRLGNAEIASNLLRRALELDALSQPALVALLRIKLDSDALDASLDWVRRLPQMRKPPAELMQEIVRKLESDRYLFLAERTATIDELQTRGGRGRIRQGVIPITQLIQLVAKVAK